MIVKRAVLFIDGMNTYMSAREAFFVAGDRAQCGQFDPIKLGVALMRHRPLGWNDAHQRQLHEVRTYQGSPAQNQDKRGYAADRRHRAAWEKRGVKVTHRPLRYRPGEGPQEKGIDVALAIDFVRMAVQGDYELGIIASADTDLLPAVEYVRSRGIMVETMTWWQQPLRGLTLPDGSVWCHRFTEAVYQEIRDETDYNVGAA